jgi:Arc/MetJ family transcription regulator
MRRTSLVLDENLLAEATRVLGVKTYSAAVSLALAETLRVKKILELPSFFGSGIWQDDLSIMREDRKPARKRTKK